MVSYKALNTLGKRRVSNTRHAVWDVDAGQRRAQGKRRVSNACYAVWYVDAGQRSA